MQKGLLKGYPKFQNSDPEKREIVNMGLWLRLRMSPKTGERWHQGEKKTKGKYYVSLWNTTLMLVEEEPCSFSIFTLHL